jgi:hypothetical protein
MERLTPDQARAVREAVHPTRGYLGRLVERMDRTNLSLRDPHLYQLVPAAEDALHRLWV